MSVDPYSVTNPDLVVAFEEMAVGLSPHPFDAEGFTGYACSQMVMRDGGGDLCGLPSDHPLHAVTA